MKSITKNIKYSKFKNKKNFKRILNFFDFSIVFILPVHRKLLIEYNITGKGKSQNRYTNCLLLTHSHKKKTKFKQNLINTTRVV